VQHTIYSFSHLTLQEYFTAKYLVDNDYYKTLAQIYLTQTRWREVFLLTTNLLQSSQRKSDAFFTAMHQHLQEQINENPFLHQFITQCNQAILPVQKKQVSFGYS
jgi:predicted NACHT family NTPase